MLFGLHKTKRGLIEAGCAIVCEGQLDLITLFEAGITNVVAPQGTAFTENQARILKRFVSEVVLCFDADNAGQKAAERSLDALLAEQSHRSRRGNAAWRRSRFDDPRIGARRNLRSLSRAPVIFSIRGSNGRRASTDLDSLGAKMELARKMAETIARVQDPLMRGEVANKASARLGVPRSDFERLLTKPSRERFSTDDEPRPAVAAPPRHEIGMLCLLALRHEEARAYLLAQDWRGMLSLTPDAEILGRILASELRPDDPASLNAFMSGLPSGEEALVSSWLLQKMPPNGLEVAQGFWNGLRQATLRRQLQIAEGRMKLPRLTTGEAVNLQKQILDLTEQLRELSKFSSAHVLDT